MRLVKISELLDYFGVNLVFIDIDNDGYYEPITKTIFINYNLNETEYEKIILHELGHFIFHQHLVPLYKMPVPHLKMEYEANCFMVKQLIDMYLDYDEVITDINYVQFMNYYGLDNTYEAAVKSVLINYSSIVYA